MSEQIFISHNSLDKSVVEPVAVKLAEVFGKANIFYDSWSIQPGDGIIDKMNIGLAEMTYFLFFISRNSLQSDMVKLEWQNALYKAAKGKCKFIPIKIDDCVVPTILLQNLYIDFYNYGFDVGLSQLINVINGSQSSLTSFNKFNNVIAEIIIESKNKMSISIKAIHFQEPIARFLILIGNETNDVKINVKSDGFYNGGPEKDIKLNNGFVCNAFFVGVSRSLAPNFPVRIDLESQTDIAIQFYGLMRAVSEDKFESVPVIKKELTN